MYSVCPSSPSLLWISSCTFLNTHTVTERNVHSSPSSNFPSCSLSLSHLCFNTWSGCLDTQSRRNEQVSMETEERRGGGGGVLLGAEARVENFPRINLSLTLERSTSVLAWSLSFLCSIFTLRNLQTDTHGKYTELKNNTQWSACRVNPSGSPCPVLLHFHLRRVAGFEWTNTASTQSALKWQIIWLLHVFKVLRWKQRDRLRPWPLEWVAGNVKS